MSFGIDSPFIFSFCLVIVTNGILLISPKILQSVFDELERAFRDPDFTVSSGRILFFALLIFGVAFFAGILRFAQRRIIQGVARQMEFHLRPTSFSISKNSPPPITITSAPAI